MTGKVPFYDFPNDMAVMFKVVEGERPSRPMSCSGTAVLDSLWELLQNCWGPRAEMRSTACQIVERLVGPSIGAKPTSTTRDWDDKFTSKFRHALQPKPLLPLATEIERILFGDGWSKFSSLCFVYQLIF
jgi:hypothetical protein